MDPSGAALRLVNSWMPSRSTEKTRAPSLARRAARGRPTTSELQCGSSARAQVKERSANEPVNDGDGSAVGSRAVGKEDVVDLAVLEGLDDGERGAGEDSLDEGAVLVRDGGGAGDGRRGGDLGSLGEFSRVDEASVVVEREEPVICEEFSVSS